MTPVTAVACEAPVQPSSFPPGPLSARSIFAATLVTLLYVGVVEHKRHTMCFGETKGEIAKLVAVKYAHEAFPQWQRDHPDRECPSSLRDLSPYMDRVELKDPWGAAYVVTCGTGKLYVMSLGEDGRSNTADDIWSHL
jgi:hypothetical protein